MDNGEVTPGLDERWSFAGANAMEWVSGAAALFIGQAIGSSFFPVKPATLVIPLLFAWLLTTFGLSSLRRRFPDEEKGLRNAGMVAMGLIPTGLPAPAMIQPVWSGAPVRELAPEREFVDLGLADMLAVKLPQEEREN